jgi:hypothetical protein
MKAYQNITFEEATRILYFHYSGRPSLFLEFMEDLMSSERSSDVISPKQYQDYRLQTEENKKEK